MTRVKRQILFNKYCTYCSFRYEHPYLKGLVGDDCLNHRILNKDDKEIYGISDEGGISCFYAISHCKGEKVNGK